MSIQMKATQHYFPVAVYYAVKVVVTFESVDEIL